MRKDIYSSISSKARLLLNKPESYDVDFKQIIRGLEASDLVAFANSERGGTILIGVGETEDGNSMQKGKITGCLVGDKERLFILSKAESCIPPVEVQIIIENYNKKPFIRLEIPSGKDKPYCTAGGTYKIRGDGKNNVLLPSMLLAIFMEKQSELFLRRFKEATGELGKNLQQNNKELKGELDELVEKLLHMEDSVQERLGGLLDEIENNDFISDEITDNTGLLVDDMHLLKSKVERMECELITISKKIDRLLQKDNTV